MTSCLLSYTKPFWEEVYSEKEFAIQDFPFSIGFFLKGRQNNYDRVDSPESVSFPITKTHLYNFDPVKPHFYIVKLGFTGVYIIFLISAQKHRLWVLVRTASPRRF